MDYMDNDCTGHEPALLSYSITQPGSSRISSGNFSFQTNPWLDGTAFSMDIGTLVLVHNRTKATAFWFQATTNVIYFGAELDNSDWSCGIPFPGLTLPYKLCQTAVSFTCNYKNTGTMQVSVSVC